MSLTLLILIIIMALAFEYINGFHDTANTITTIISTKVLSPRMAILYSGCLNFFGAFMGTHVAKTIGSGIVDTVAVTQTVILAALISAIIWNLLTWYYALPSSSSHALIGGLIGATATNAGITTIHTDGLYHKVVLPMIGSPFVGFFFGLVIMTCLLNIFFRANPELLTRYFRRLQLVSSGFMAFGHGSNDAQKTMGIISLALFSYGALPSFDIPTWVIFICALTMGLGTLAGGWRIIRTMGSKVIKLRPIHGFAVEMSAASIILTASHFGIPISTTHVITTSIMGVGSTQRLSAVKWGLVSKIIWAWVLTIPVCAVLASLAFRLLTAII